MTYRLKLISEDAVVRPASMSYVKPSELLDRYHQLADQYNAQTAQLADATKERERLEEIHKQDIEFILQAFRDVEALRLRTEVAERSNRAGLIEINRLGHVREQVIAAIEALRRSPEYTENEGGYNDAIYAVLNILKADEG